MSESQRIVALSEVIEFLLVYLRKKLGPQDYAMMIEKVDFAKNESGGSNEDDER